MVVVPSLSYRLTARRPTAPSGPSSYDGLHINSHGEIVVNTIIYIVGLVVVIGAILGFFGLR